MLVSDCSGMDQALASLVRTVKLSAGNAPIN
jgi:hypothetical protein